jgi:hypothetical protein
MAASDRTLTISDPRDSPPSQYSSTSTSTNTALSPANSELEISRNENSFTTAVNRHDCP